MLFTPAFATDQAIEISANHSVQAAIAGTTDPEIAAQEQKLKRAIYERGVRECVDLVTPVSLTRAITGINVSTQINRNYEQLPSIYVNSILSMQAKPK